MQRSPICLRIALCLAGLGLMLATQAQDAAAPAAEVQAELGQLRTERRQLARRKRRMIFNNDGDDVIYYTPVATPENLLKVRTTPLLGSLADSIFYSNSMCFGDTLLDSKVMRPFIAKDYFTKNSLPDFLAQGTDPLKIMVEFCKKNDIEIFFDMRMNDTHDAGLSGYGPHLFTQFKKDNPECLVGTPTDRPRHGTWSSVDYAREEVRDLLFRFFQEVCQNYDIDGLEMDFFRHACLFKSVARGGTASQAELDGMTGLLRRIRAMTEEEGLRRGRPILMAARVPDSVEYCRGVGLDLERWLADDLLDILVGSGYFRLNRWEYLVELGHRYKVAVYPSFSESRVRGETKRFTRNSPACRRARAMEAWLAGVDGIYMFNHFNPRDPLWRELGDPEVLRFMDKLYFVTVRNGNPNSYLSDGARFRNVPLLTPANPAVVSATAPLIYPLIVGDDLAAAEKAGIEPVVNCHVQAEGAANAGSLQVTLNGSRLAGGARNGEWLDFPVDPALVKRGENQLRVGLALEAAEEAAPTPADLDWDLDSSGELLATFPDRMPWRSLFECTDYAEEARDGCLFLADRGQGKNNMVNLAYPWKISPDKETVVETRVKVVESADPLGVCVRVANGATVEYVTLETDRIGLKFAGLTCEMDTTDDFHTYKIVIQRDSIRVYVDGKLRLDGAGRYTASATDRTHWLQFLYGLEDWSKCCLVIGSATGPGTGEALWEYVRYRSKETLLRDLVLSISFPRNA